MRTKVRNRAAQSRADAQSHSAERKVVDGFMTVVDQFTC